MKKVLLASQIILFFAAITSTSCTKKISAPEIVRPAASTQKIYFVNVDWDKTENGGVGTFDLPANAKDAYIVFQDQQILLIDRHPVRYMSCYWLYLFYGPKSRIYFTPISGEVSPVLDTDNIKILVRE